METRVSAMEDQVFGEMDKNGQYAKAADVVLGFNNRLGNALGDYERAVMIMKRLDELETYLDPLYGADALCAPATLAGELLGTEQQIRQLAQQLDQLQQLQPLLDSEHIQGHSDLRARLEAVSVRHLSHAERLGRLQDRVRSTTTAYHQVVGTLADTLVQLEEQVARAEAKK